MANETQYEKPAIIIYDVETIEKFIAMASSAIVECCEGGQLREGKG